MFCPSQEAKIMDRTCSVCFKYFSSLTLLKEHAKIHKKPVKITMVRPKRVCARRANEALAILANDNESELEWIDSEFLDTPEVETFPDLEKNVTIPIISIEENLQHLWETTE